MMRRIQRRATAVAAALAITIGSAAVLAPRASAATAQSGHKVGTVRMSSLHHTATNRRTLSVPKVKTRSAGRSTAQVARTATSVSRLRHVTTETARTGARTVSNPTRVEQLQDFSGVSHDEQVDQINGADITPPDTQVATGPGAVMEGVNSAFVLMGRHGENRTRVDQYQFWGPALTATDSSDFLSDPKIDYDTTSGRFFTTILIFNQSGGNDSFIGLAVSETNDPTGLWDLWVFNTATNVLDDQPLLGVSIDKVILSWNAFDWTATANQGNQLGAQFLVIDKAALVAGTASPGADLSDLYDGSNQAGHQAPFLQSMVPTTSETSTNVYMVFNEEDLNSLTWSTVGLVRVTGVPVTGGTDSTAIGSIVGLDLTDTQGNPITVSAPPFADQPNSDHLLDDSDGRMQSAVLSDNFIYTAGSVAVDLGNGNVVSSLLLEQMQASQSGITFNYTALVSNDNLFDPAVVVDGNGVPFYSFTRSSSQTAPSSSVNIIDWNGSGSSLPKTVISSGAGQGAYNCGAVGCQLFPGSNPPIERWGDYSGIAVDPTNPNDVWVATEFAAGNGANWGTSIARVTIAQPSMTGFDVSSGRTSGFTRVTVTGDDFDPASATGLFGGATAMSTQWVDPEHVVVTSPPHTAGGFPLQVRTDDGTSNSSGNFTYVYPPPSTGYWLTASDGGLFPFGDAKNHSYGSTGNIHLNAPVIQMVPTVSGNGYWMLCADGGIFPFGDAKNHSYGSTGNLHLNAPIVGMARTQSGNGYWLVAADGGIFPFGDALSHSYGSHGGQPLNKPIIGMAATATGNGYYLYAGDGGLFPYGDALQHSYGSTGGVHLNKPIVGMAVMTDGNGYWMVASDGGMFPFGEAQAHSYGSTGNVRLNKPIVGMADTGDDGGYWLVASDGGIFPFGDGQQHSYGSTGNITLNKPIVGMAALPA